MKKSMKLGMGGRFSKGVSKIMKQHGIDMDSAKAIMANAGRKKYGQKKMSKWASRGRRRAS